MKCPACGKPMQERSQSETTKFEHRKLLYTFRYLTCGEHAWQTDQQQEEMFQKRDALKRGAFQKSKAQQRHERNKSKNPGNNPATAK